MAGSAAVSPAVHDLVNQRAGGNPLFIEQLVIMLREETLLGASEAALRSVTLPVSLYGLFLERVDRLDLTLRDALRLASVLGVEFEREIYLMVSERAAPVPEGVAATRPGAFALEELVARGFLIRRDSPDGDLYAFDQPQMQAAVYGTVLAENRQIVHGLAAAALERFFEGRLVRQLPRILHHFSQSGNIARTVHYGRLAGERALAIAAYDEAAEQLGIAAALQDRLPDTSGLVAGETLHRLATAFEWKGQLRQAATYAEQAAARLSAEGGEPADRERAGRRGHIAMTLGEVYGLLGEWQRSIDCYAHAERWFNDAAMPVESAEARCCRGFSHRARGQPERGVELAREGWAVLEATNHLPAIGRAGHELGNLLRDLGRYDEALRIFDRAVAGGDELRREGRLAESMWGAIAARSGRAMTYAASGDIAAAIADQSRANELARRDGNRVAHAISEYHLAAHYLERGDLRAADESAERAYRQSREIDMPGRAFKCRLIQARVHVRANDWEPALERVREAFAVIERGQVPDDALSDAVDLLVSAADRVPHARLVQTMRIAWPHVSQSGSTRLQEGAATLASILGIDQEMTTTRGATVAPPLDEEATLLPGQPEGDEHA